jgi:hypothetical protein
VQGRQSTFLHQARRAKVQKRRQHGTLGVIFDKQSGSLKVYIRFYLRRNCILWRIKSVMRNNDIKEY